MSSSKDSVTFFHEGQIQAVGIDFQAVKGPYNEFISRWVFPLNFAILSRD